MKGFSITLSINQKGDVELLAPVRLKSSVLDTAPLSPLPLVAALFLPPATTTVVVAERSFVVAAATEVDGASGCVVDPFVRDVVDKEDLEVDEEEDDEEEEERDDEEERIVDVAAGSGDGDVLEEDVDESVFVVSVDFVIVVLVSPVQTGRLFSSTSESTSISAPAGLQGKRCRFGSP